MRSIAPLADLSSCHPVHRANAMLRESLLGPFSARLDPPEAWGHRLRDPESARVEFVDGRPGITQPDSLTILPDLVLDGVPTSQCQSIVTDTSDGSAPRPSLENTRDGYEMLDYNVQKQLRTMVHAFHRRQRQASLVVACSIIATLVLTLCGLILLFGMTKAAESRDSGVSEDNASVVQRTGWPTSVRTNRTTKSAPLLIHARSKATIPSDAGAPDARIILAGPGWSIALGPLLPIGSARYLLLRGLPDDATLSAGRRTGPGTWMVKGEDVAGLSLMLGATSSGDYPAEAYPLGGADGPQARRRLVLRVGPQASTGQETETASDRARDQESLREHARLLFTKGSIPTTRHLLKGLAERGNVDAAYELALTYDQEVLAKAGFQDIEGDMEIAQTWYAHAAQEGHAGAAQRLRTFAKRRAGA